MKEKRLFGSTIGSVYFLESSIGSVCFRPSHWCGPAWPWGTIDRPGWKQRCRFLLVVVFDLCFRWCLSGFGDVDDVMNDTNDTTVVNQNQIKIGLYSRSGTSLVMVTVVTSLLWFKYHLNELFNDWQDCTHWTWDARSTLATPMTVQPTHSSKVKSWWYLAPDQKFWCFWSCGPKCCGAAHLQGPGKALW